MGRRTHRHYLINNKNPSGTLFLARSRLTGSPFFLSNINSSGESALTLHSLLFFVIVIMEISGPLPLWSPLFCVFFARFSHFLIIKNWAEDLFKSIGLLLWKS